MKKVTYPHTIREAGEEVVIYRAIEKRDVRELPKYFVVYRANGVRQKLKRSDEATAHADAKAALLKLLNRPVPFALSEGATVLAACKANLSGLNIEPDLACLEYARAVRKLEGASLADAVAAYLRHKPVKTDKATHELTDLFIAEKEAVSSAAYMQGLGRRLRRFGRAFHGRMVSTIETDEIQSWLTKLALGPRARNNERQVVLTFFNWCQKMRYLPRGVENEAAQVHMVKATTTIEIFTAEEVATLLHALEAEAHPVLPYAVTGFFAGIRPRELSRLKFEEAFRWKHNDIEVRADQAKTGTRRLVPMEKNWKQWMANYYNSTGFIGPRKADRQLAEFAKTKVGLRWPFDVMRHSYISHMVAKLEQIGCVALWAGNSEAVVKSNYLKMVTKPEGEAYFEILPKLAKIIHIGENAA